MTLSSSFLLSVSCPFTYTSGFSKFTPALMFYSGCEAALKQQNLRPFYFCFLHLSLTLITVLLTKKKRCTAKLLKRTSRKSISAYRSNFDKFAAENTVSRSTRQTVVISLKISSFSPSKFSEGLKLAK